MLSTFFELLLAPIAVGTTIVLFSYWLNKDDNYQYTIKNAQSIAVDWAFGDSC